MPCPAPPPGYSFNFQCPPHFITQIFPLAPWMGAEQFERHITSKDTFSKSPIHRFTNFVNLALALSLEYGSVNEEGCTYCRNDIGS